MQELFSNMQELADTLARLGQPIEEIALQPEAFEPWLEFEPVNGLTYL